MSRFLFTVVAVTGLFVFLSPELKNVSRETFAAETTTNAQVSQSLTCQCGCGLTVANCNMPTCSFSVPTRAEIDQMIGKGMGRAQIIAFYRHKYGEKVLSAPTTEGFNLLAWTMPFIALVVGGRELAHLAIELEFVESLHRKRAFMLVAFDLQLTGRFCARAA